MSALIHVHDIQNNRIGEFRLKDRLLLGKADDCDIALSSPYISPEHALFEAEGPQAFVKSLGLNRLLVNDTDVPRGERHKMTPDDVISVPGWVLHVTGLRATERSTDYEMERQLSDFKRDIHRELLAAA